MSAHVIDPEYNWKSAAAQEGVDYDAVMKSFMDQSYGVVANKAKVLFQDPYRLGFEIVHRNEKATKMVGIFAFRCNKALLYAPVFFVNGEVKAADMLYRGDVKRFVPLTDEWCAFLVRGANQEAGELSDKNRQRQPDAYLDRLAYPQRVKYASTEGVALFKEILAHCADDTPSRKLIPHFIKNEGPIALEKLASLIEGSDIAKRYVVEHYTAEELQDLSGWQEKQAAAWTDPEENSIVFVCDPTLAKSAAERDEVMDRGYSLVDNRPKESTNIIIEEVENSTIHDLASPCVADVIMADGKTEECILLKRDDSLSVDGGCPTPVGSCYNRAPKFEFVYHVGKKQLLDIGNAPVFGDEKLTKELPKLIDPMDLSAGKVYIRVDMSTMGCSDVFVLDSYDKDGEAAVLNTVSTWGGAGRLFFSPGREESGGKYISDNSRFLEVDADIEKREGRVVRIDTKWDNILMDSAGIDKWMRTAGGIAKSQDVTVTRNATASFDITSHDGSGMKKVARDLGMLEAHLKLATDFSLTCDKAGKLLDKATDDGTTRVRLYDAVEKAAFTTTMGAMQPWIQGFDPELGVKLDSPQRQVISTHTPQRAQQTPRYGDHYDRGQMGQRDPEEDGLPADALLTKSPEELAVMATQYNMPHIFDHGELQRMSTSMFNTVTQIQQYIPDLETGVDRYYRILFLLRYRPADFEEAYGKDALLEMEQELSELANMSGDNLLRMLKRFDINKYSGQEA
jgi:hypothetical protein